MEREIKHDGSPIARFHEYLDAIESGRRVAGRLERLAVQRHRRDEEEQERRGVYFDEDELDFTVKLCEGLKHSKGKWAKEYIHLEPWEVFILGSLFAWKRCDTGKRRFRSGLVCVARKNGKSLLGATIGHRCFAFDNEQGAEVYTFATKLKQAKIVHEEAKRMARSSDWLSSRVTVLRDNLSIATTNSKYEPLASDSHTEDGLNVHCAIGDEIHAHPDATLWDVIDTATGAREQPLVLGITTAGDADATESLYFRLKDYSVKVLENIIDDDTWFCFIAQLDTAKYDESGAQIAEADDWTDEAVWPKANPNLGVCVFLDDLRQKAKKALEDPAKMLDFQKKHLNMEVASYETWIYPEIWKTNAGGDWYGADGIKQEVMDRFRGRRCSAGLDLSSVGDLTALVLAFRTEDGFYDILPYCWCPRNNAIGRQRDKRVPYMAWANLGQMFLTEGDSVDYGAIINHLLWLREEWKIQFNCIAVDPHNARATITELQEKHGFEVLEHQQGWKSMNDPIKQTTKLILDRKVRHGGHLPLQWCVSNVQIPANKTDNMRFDKDKSREKIDLGVAMTMAIGREVIIGNAKPQRSFYADNDVEFST